MMKFLLPKGVAESPEIKNDYDSAKVFEKIHVGKMGVYFPSWLRVRFIPYDTVDRIFIRIHEVNGKLCCGSTVFQYFRLVFVKDGKEFADYINENEASMDGALAAIAEAAPDVKTGVEK